MQISDVKGSKEAFAFGEDFCIIERRFVEIVFSGPGIFLFFI